MAENRIELATEFMTKLGALKLDDAGQHLADDATMLLPYLESIPPAEGKTAIINTLSVIAQMFERMVFTFDAWYPGQDPDVLIGEYRSECPRVGNGGIYRNSYITVFRFRGDKITLYKEYLNPTKV